MCPVQAQNGARFAEVTYLCLFAVVAPVDGDIFGRSESLLP